jgi:hypothetical protein
MNPVVDDALSEVVHEMHPDVAAKLTPDQWQQIIQAIVAVVSVIINIVNPPKN